MNEKCLHESSFLVNLPFPHFGIFKHDFATWMWSVPFEKRALAYTPILYTKTLYLHTEFVIQKVLLKILGIVLCNWDP